MNRSDRIFVAGHRGLAGSAIIRRLERAGYDNLLVRTHAELNLTDQDAANAFFRGERPEYVILAAARVGGIVANDTFPADFIRDNLQIQTNVIEAAYRSGARGLLFLASSCVYPKLAPQPIKEEYLLTGPLEPTNEAYAIAKIAGIKMCDAYRRQYGASFVSVMPTNLYGPHDNFDLQTSHVLPALIRKFHEARLAGESHVTVWGSGTPRREFLHADDLADACLFLMQRNADVDIVNVGWGKDIEIRELAELVRSIVGFAGAIEFDASKPDGTPRKLLDTARVSSLGWAPRIPLAEGIEQTYRWYVECMNQRVK